jgi:hypothetical protein
MDRLLGRDKFQHAKDAYCGLCILALYFLYLMVVKGALSVFDCSKVLWTCALACFGDMQGPGTSPAYPQIGPQWSGTCGQEAVLVFGVYAWPSGLDRVVGVDHVCVCAHRTSRASGFWTLIRPFAVTRWGTRDKCTNRNTEHRFVLCLASRLFPLSLPLSLHP